ncbi:uncharacterized protein AB9X84_003390 [Acanthopagrus schlegelii]
MQYEWVDDDSDLPPGAIYLGLSTPIDDRKYVMYHGTTKGNAEAISASGFHQSADGMLGHGVYLRGHLQRASLHPAAIPESDRAVIKVVVDVGKVIAINCQNHPDQNTWHDRGYDTAWMKSGLEENCVRDPKRIQFMNIINPTPV